jgi:hypothetical protein
MQAATSFNRKERKGRKERPHRACRSLTPFALFALFAVTPAFALAEEAADPSVRLFDTGAAVTGLLTDKELTARAGWTLVPENDVTHAFKGAAVVMNDRLAAAFRPDGPGGELYSKTDKGWRERALLWWVPCYLHYEPTVRLVSIHIKENTAGAVTVQGEFKAGPGGIPASTYRLTAGQPLIELRPCELGPGAAWLRCRASSVVVPDFFGDDMVFRAADLGADRTRLPTEGCLLNLLPEKDAIVMYSWRPRYYWTEALKLQEPGSVQLIGVGPGGDPDERFWVAFLEGQNLWHERPVQFADEGTTVALDWKPPFAAKWRADLVRPDHTADSWFFRSADETDPLAAESPCRLDGDRATVQIPPPAKPQPGVDPRVGPLLVYPLDRSRATPLTTFTPVDILRNTLGVGPCQYILESEGLASQEVATPDQVMTWVEKQFRKKGGKEAADEIKERLKAMTEHVGRARARLTKYHDFAASAGALVRVLGTSEAATRLAEEALPAFARLAQASAEGLAATDAARLAKWADEVAALIGRDDAAAQVARPAADIRAVGHALDRALARSRMAVRWLREQVAAAGLKDEREAEKARQVQALAEQILQGK